MWYRSPLVVRALVVPGRYLEHPRKLTEMPVGDHPHHIIDPMGLRTRRISGPNIAGYYPIQLFTIDKSAAV